MYLQIVLHCITMDVSFNLNRSKLDSLVSQHCSVTIQRTIQRVSIPGIIFFLSWSSSSCNLFSRSSSIRPKILLENKCAHCVPGVILLLQDTVNNFCGKFYFADCQKWTFFGVGKNLILPFQHFYVFNSYNVQSISQGFNFVRI